MKRTGTKGVRQAVAEVGVSASPFSPGSYHEPGLEGPHDPGLEGAGRVADDPGLVSPSSPGPKRGTGPKILFLLVTHIMENLFGVVDNKMLQAMPRYEGRTITQEYRAREAWNLLDAGNKTIMT